MMRVGIGWDAHAFEEGRPLRLGGVTIPYEIGLAGHSDADVLIHALCDAMLGAAALGDLGSFFPDDDEEFKGIDSTILLKRVNEMLAARGYEVANADSVIIAQKPRVSMYLAEMKINIASILGIEPDRICVKASSPEGLGAIGRSEGIAAQAVVLLSRR